MTIPLPAVVVCAAHTPCWEESCLSAGPRVGAAHCPPSHTPGGRAATGSSLTRGNRPCPEIIGLQSAPRGGPASLQPEEQIASIFQLVPLNSTNISLALAGC